MKFLKYALAAAGALVFVAAAVVAWFALTFDVRDYEPRIVALVKEKTGRTLTIRGQTHLSFWPDLGVTLGPIALSERGSDAVFAEVANARLVAKLAPLFDKQLVADELHLEGASVRIVRDRDGKLNIEDLLSGEGGTLDFDIARARVQRSRVVYEDLASGARHEIADLDLTAGRLANGVATPVTLSFKASDAAKAYAVSSNVEGRFTFDLTRRSYAMEDMTLHVAGRAAGASDLIVTLKSPRLDWGLGVLTARNAAFEVDVTREARKLHATVTAAVRADATARTIELTELTSKFVATGAGLPKRGIEGALAGRATVDASTAHATLAGTVLDSRVNAKLAIAYAAPRYTFALDVDALDLDRLGAASAGAKRGEGFDVASLADMHAAGTVRIGTLKSSGVVAKNVQIAMKP